MHKKSVLFGMGIGILMMVAVTFVTYIVQRAAYLNENTRLMAMVDELEAAPVVGSPVDSEYIVIRARSIGMVFPDEVEPETVTVYVEQNGQQNDNGYISNDLPDEPEEQDYIPEQTPEPSPTATPVQQGWGITILSGITASEVASEFEYRGLVENGDEFLQFLIDRGYETRIQIGYFEVPLDANFDQIVNIIIYGN